MRNTKKDHARFRVGDWVSFPWGTTRVRAQVVEDLGCIGHKGRRLYGLRMELPDDEGRYGELPEENLEAATAAAE